VGPRFWCHLISVSMLHQRFTCSLSSIHDAVLAAPFSHDVHDRGFLTEAAHGTLKPPPTRQLRRVLLHLSYSMALSRLLDTTTPRLLTEAACGSLKPPPTGRLRRAFLHLSYSMTLSHLLDTTTLATGRASFGLTRAGLSPAGLHQLWLAPSEIQASGDIVP
jgi:hypothetical protein